MRIMGVTMNIKKLLTKLILVTMLLAPMQAQAVIPKETMVTVCMNSLMVIGIAFYATDRASIYFENKFSQALEARNLTQLKYLRYAISPNLQRRFLMGALCDHNLEKIQLLLQCGVWADIDDQAQVDIRMELRRNPLGLAIKKNNVEIVKLLLDFGARTNCLFDERMITPIMFASYYGSSAIVQLLLDYKADVNSKTIDGETALMIASENGYSQVVQLLLDNGAKTHVKNNNGQTAFDYARRNQDAESREATCAVLNKISKTRRNNIVRMLRPLDDQLPTEMADYIAQYVYPHVTLDNTQVTIN